MEAADRVSSGASPFVSTIDRGRFPFAFAPVADEVTGIPCELGGDNSAEPVKAGCGKFGVTGLSRSEESADCIWLSPSSSTIDRV